MGKTLLYVAILGLLGFGIYYFVVRENDSPYSKEEAGFTIKDTAAIGKLFLATGDGESVTVERTPGGWTVNKQYKAMPSTLNLLLQTLTQQVPLYPVTQSAYDNVIKTMAANGIKVEVYDREGKKMRVFYVGGVALNNSGTNMLIEGAKTPYVVHVPGFNGYLTSRYTVNLRDWRDRTVFNLPAEEVKSVSLQYEGKPVNSFEIVREGDSVMIKADPAIAKGLDGPNTRRAKVYLKYFANVNCEGYLNGLPDNDTTIKSAPKYLSIDIKGMHNQHQHVDIYWMAINKRSKNRLTSNPDVPDDYDSDRLYAIMNDYKDTVVIQQFAFHDIFHKAFEFFQKDGTGTTPDSVKPAPNVLMNKNR